MKYMSTFGLNNGDLSKRLSISVILLDVQLHPNSLSSSWFSGAFRGGKKTPNVLFIVCDDLNTHISPWGYEHIETSTLERLAAESVRFRRAFCQYPVCGPSRASFLSGLYPESTGILNNSADIREERPGTITIPQFFKENGYWTASVGKVFHNADNEHGDIAWNEHVRFVNDELPIISAARKKFENERGSVEKPANRKAWRELRKDVLLGLDSQTPPGYGRSGLKDEQHKDGKNARQVVEWLEDEPDGEKPFIIALGIHKPHVAFLAPENYFDIYPVEEIVYEADDPDLWESLPSTAKSNRHGAFGFELGKEKDALRREYMQAYHACITFVDAQLRLVLDALKDSGQWEDTIIVFTSDHGYHLGDHFLWGKVSLFDIGAKVPFMIRTPGLSRNGASSEAMVELIDIFPTLADLSGLEIPDHLQGQSGLRIQRGNERKESRLFFAGPKMALWQMARWRRAIRLEQGPQRKAKSRGKP